jgi:hypothetical protein
MSNGQWHEDQNVGEKTMRDLRARSLLDQKLADDLRASGITLDDLKAIDLRYSVDGFDHAHRVIIAVRAIQWWMFNGGLK